MTTPPGWYDDGHGALRWWDGAQWTEHVQAPAAAAEPAEGSSPAAADATLASGETAPAAIAAVDAATGAAAPGDTATHAATADAATDAAAAALGFADAPATVLGFAEEPPAGGIPPVPVAPAGTASAPAGAYIPDASPWAPAPDGPKRASKLWILWVVVGVVVVGLIVAAVIIVPAVIAWVTGAAAPVSATSDDESAAVAAVELYDDAWQEVDCEKYEAATTGAFREQFGFTTCDDFDAQAQAFADATTDYSITVTGIEHDGSSIVVSTSESYGITVDENGAPLDEPEAVVDRYAYTVVEDDGTWRLDAVGED